MKAGRGVVDLLTPLSTSASVEDGLAGMLRRLVEQTGAAAGALIFTPPREAPIIVTASGRRLPAEVGVWLRASVRAPVARPRLARVTPPGWPRGRAVALRAPLGTPARRLGTLLLLGRALTPGAVAPGFSRELGESLDRVWHVRRRTLRTSALSELARLLDSAHSLDAVFRAFGEAAAKLVAFDSIAVSLLDGERGEFEIVDVVARGVPLRVRRDGRMPVAGTLFAELVAKGTPLRVDDVAGADVPEASRRVFAERGYRAVALAPLRSAGGVFGAVTLASARPGAFDDEDVEIIGELARPLASAIESRRLLEEGARRARETRALLEAGRAVTASLDVDQTIRVILEAARSVLGADSCGLATLDPQTDELVTVASLDLPATVAKDIRVKVGEGIGGLAVRERRPVQSRDLYDDPRARYPQIARATGFRSMLVAPLRVGDRATGAISVFRKDVHAFSAGEEELLLALADQAAIALEHARLYTALEGMVAERTRELDAQKRFVEVVLETLPLGVFVLDAELRIVRANPEGGRALGFEPDTRSSFPAHFGAGTAPAIEAFLGAAFETRWGGSTEVEIAIAGETKVFRLTRAPFESGEERVAHAVVLVEDVTRAKRLERQMLLTERLTTAGRLAAGVAHELNNPLATIAGCAESLRGRLAEGGLAKVSELAEFPHYLGLIEEETFRCKEITGTLLQFVRDPGSQRAPTDLNGLVLKAIELLSHQSRFAEGRFVTELDPTLPTVAVNEGQLRQVFIGLASNALEAMEGRGTLTVRSRLLRGEVEVELEDDGPGVPEEILPRIFDPFFTTKAPGQGTGLGLAIAQGIVADHGGRIEVTSRPGKGSLFRVVLPA
jgi:two-component system, NtrC family, sensor kinase